MEIKVKNYLKLPIEKRNKLKKRIKFLIFNDNNINVHYLYKITKIENGYKLLYVESQFMIIIYENEKEFIAYNSSNSSIQFKTDDIGINNDYIFILDEDSLKQAFPNLIDKIENNIKKMYHKFKQL